MSLTQAQMLLLPFVVGLVTPVLGQPAGVASTLHNLSASGSGEVRALSETQICKFCHIPHNAVTPVPLWGHTLSRAQYTTPRVANKEGRMESVAQPDGSSRLCLSCHDGTVALGDIGGASSPIAMAGTARLGGPPRNRSGLYARYGMVRSGIDLADNKQSLDRMAAEIFVHP